MTTKRLVLENAEILNWTGHPLVDIGVATLCALSKKTDPRHLTLEDLDSCADMMAEYYFSGLMTSYLTCVFMNSAYVQPNMSEEKRKQYENSVLRAHRVSPETSGAGRCPFSSKTSTVPVHRGQLPLLTGEDVLNFYPAGRGFLPVHGPYLVALQALPLGGRRTEGKLLVVHADEPILTLAFAERYLADNLRLLNLAKNASLPNASGPVPELEREQSSGLDQKKKPKYPDAKAPVSLIGNDLMEVYRTRVGPEFRNHRASLTAYWLSNSGQGPSLQVFQVPAQVTRFLQKADAAICGATWRHLIAQSWRKFSTEESVTTMEDGVEGKKSKKNKKKSGGPQVPGGPGRSRNDVLADLFSIYENGFLDLAAAKVFLRRHLLGDSSYWNQKTITTNTVGPRLRQPEKTKWDLTELFLKEVMGMDERRIVAIKDFADRLASHINTANDRGLFRSLVYGQRPWEVRNALTKAQRNQAKDHGQLLFGLAEYLEVFEADDAVGRNDWSLARDLISIRLVEQLHVSGFFGKGENADLLVEPESQSAA